MPENTEDEIRSQLGVIPHKVWLMKRANDLHAAIGRRISQGTFDDQVNKWTAELLYLLEDIRKES